MSAFAKADKLIPREYRPPSNPLPISSFPRPPLCERTPRHLEVRWDGHTIASTTEAYWMLETFHPPTYYFPPSSIAVPLTKTAHSSYCEWKGAATYFAVAHPARPAGDVVATDRAWCYDTPSAKYESIKGYVSFYSGPWECFVDGEKVEAQPGDFYGGWVTSDVDMTSVKGAAGTRHW